MSLKSGRGKGCEITANGNVTVNAGFVLEPCVVPNVRRKTLKAAKLSLKKAFCSLGRSRPARRRP